MLLASVSHARPAAVPRPGRAAPALRRAGPPLARRAASRRPVPSAPRAAAGGADADPYQVLGLPSTADSAAVSRAYNRKKFELRGNDAGLAALEAAHTRVVMAQLTARMKGGAPADPGVAFADRGVYFPWRPRRADAGRTAMLYSAAVQAFLVFYAFISPNAGTQPVVYSICAGAVTNVLKLGKIFPGAQGPDASPEAKARGAKNLGRGLLLAVVAAFLGCAVVYTIPDAIVSAAGRSMPLWFYENERIILTLGSAAANWIMGAFYR